MRAILGGLAAALVTIVSLMAPAVARAEVVTEDLRLPGGPMSATDSTPVELDADLYLPTTTPAPGGSGFFVVDTNTPAPGAAKPLMISYSGTNIVFDPCARKPSSWRRRASSYWPTPRAASASQPGSSR